MDAGTTVGTKPSPEGDERPLLVNVGRAADLLGCGRSFLYILIARGELPVVKLGRLTRFRLSDLNALVDRMIAPR